MFNNARNAWGKAQADYTFMLVTVQPSPLKFLSLGATGMKTLRGMEHVIANLEQCRNANGGIVEVITKSGLLQRRELRVNRRSPKVRFGHWFPPSPPLQGRAGGGSWPDGGEEQWELLSQLLVYLSSFLLPLSFNSRSPDGEWLPGPLGNLRTCLQRAMPMLQSPCYHLEQWTRWVYSRMKEDWQACPTFNVIGCLRR